MKEFRENPARMALAVGSESAGVSDDVLHQSDRVVTIPIGGG
ncbi:MAG TPA: RNA methyltransferase, partial [Eubacteriaceae bacterium]|nr:RNA methyltransferase [Eubacteriaceae bacterium]